MKFLLYASVSLKITYRFDAYYMYLSILIWSNRNTTALLYVDIYVIGITWIKENQV